ncbi:MULTISPECIES: hypothetical protein [Achromobacter]|uniref:Lipoprotein n=2 Tax=Achromobacter piechaudii TaxID=72556 RepID=A0A6S7DE26_9BURK|nr:MULTISPECIES: hypothetical protein [Achromobacter]EFF73590.1 hypothetical protein HMPREF0004_5035 [Achromobacter piechaudii ATCC 43553]KNY05527.1 hypothetical protein AKG08_24375 [Achromobacter piechaudii]MPS80638.1 hypothetical protein [Achromobacter sp.]CAB3734781.1 hypothetical protein LMG1873_05158 [Achromobacter piechaudii]CAB3820282.1 hypothetical protein LMG1861_00216 [Achromobacter piechaudii]
MKVRIALSLAVLTALSACANVKDVRKRDPVFYGATQRSADEYTTCVADAWKNMGVNFQRKEVRNGFELIQEDSLGVEAVLSTITWKGKTEARLSTRIARRDQSIIEPANLCL